MTPDLRLERAAERLCALPPRVLYELLAEIAHRHGATADIRDLAERYATLDPNVLRAIGGDKFPPRIQAVT